MRSFSNALFLAAAALTSVSASALAQATNDIDVIESRQRSQEFRQQRIERAREQSQQVQEQRQVFQPRAEQQGNVEVRRAEPRRDGGFFNRRNDAQQGNVEVRRDDRRFDNRRGGDANRVPPRSEVVGIPQDNQRTDGRRFEDRQFDNRRFDRRDGQRFSRNDDRRWDGDERRRFDSDDFKRRDEIKRDGNWYRDSNGKWWRRDGRYYGNRDNRDFGYSGDRKDFRWNRDWRRDSRYDWQRYRFSNRSFFRQPRYYDPFGSRYGYKRFSIGIRIGSGYYSDRYWISDPFAYRLPYADGPYRWIRYYDDVLLVDLRNGEVIDVVYDFFW